VEDAVHVDEVVVMVEVIDDSVLIYLNHKVLKVPLNFDGFDLP
jgi:hypothetical protein